jgi:phosphoglycolate phosphatase-like HAD superfamily hydrolase
VAAHWTWRDRDPRPAGSAVVIDLDGVISDAANRQHHLAPPRRDWQAFFDACGEDDVIDEMRVLLHLLDPTVQVVILTSRPVRVRPATETWLRRHGIRWDVLLMREGDDFEPSLAFKQAAIAGLRAHGFDLALGIEDDRRNVDMLRSEGIPSLYIHSGYYDRRDLGSS